MEEAGGVLSTTDAGLLLGVTRQAVEKRVRTGTLLALTVGSQAAIPAFQIRDGAILPGLNKVLAALRVESPWTRLNFFLMKHAELGNMRPMDLLIAGKADDVVTIAAGFGDHGAP